MGFSAAFRSLRMIKKRDRVEKGDRLLYFSKKHENKVARSFFSRDP